MHPSIHLHIHVHVHVQAQHCIDTSSIDTCTSTRLHTCMHASTHPSIHTCTSSTLHRCINSMHECMHASIYTYMYIHNIAYMHQWHRHIQTCTKHTHTHNPLYILPYIGEWEGYLLIAKCRGPRVPIDDTLPNLNHILWRTDGQGLVNSVLVIESMIKRHGLGEFSSA